MANNTWHGQIRPGDPLWTDDWIVTIGGLMGRSKNELGEKPDQKQEPSTTNTQKPIPAPEKPEE